MGDGTEPTINHRPSTIDHRPLSEAKETTLNEKCVTPEAMTPEAAAPEAFPNAFLMEARLLEAECNRCARERDAWEAKRALVEQELQRFIRGFLYGRGVEVDAVQTRVDLAANQWETTARVEG